MSDYEAWSHRARLLEDQLRTVMRERDRLREVADSYVDELSHIAFAVAPHAGAVHHDDILTLVQVVVGERDHLRTAAKGFKAERDRLRAVADAAGRWKAAKAMSVLASLTADPDYGLDELERAEGDLVAALDAPDIDHGGKPLG